MFDFLQLKKSCHHIISLKLQQWDAEDIVTKVAAARLFEAGPVDMHNIAPKILPETVALGKILEGDGDASTIK